MKKNRSRFPRRTLQLALPVLTTTALAQTPPTPDPAASAATLPAITVTGSADPRAPYAGGQVARGGGLGLLGERDTFDTPFSQTSYTAEHVQNQQARTIGEVLESNPSVRRAAGRFSAQDDFVIRGFAVTGYDMSYDGLYGLTSARRNGIEGIERIELLKGPNALLNGVPPSGGIGGAVNLVPKRATPAPIGTATLGYVSDANFGAHVDLGRRFGERQQFGARLNLAHREGDTPFDYSAERQSDAHLALDWIGERTRLFALLNHEKFDADAPIFLGWTLAPGVPVPRAPDNRTNPNPPGTYTGAERQSHVLRGEFDLTDAWLLGLGYGWQRIDEPQYVTYRQTILDAAGTVTEPTVYRLRDYDRRHRTVDLKLAGRFGTAAVDHRLAFGAYRLVQDLDYTTQIVNRADPALSNLYDLQVNYVQPGFDGVPAPLRGTRSVFGGVAVSDTVSAFAERVQFTFGVRRQRIESFDRPSNATLYDEEATTPAVALLLKPLDRLSLYANYIEALSQAPAPPATASNADDTFPPGRSRQRELGAKWDGGRWGLTGALFEITQPSGITSPATTGRFSLDGEQRHRGVEIETFGEPADGLRLLGGATWIDAELVRTQSGVNEGRRPVGVPQWAASLGGELDLPAVVGVTLTARAVFNGDQYVDAANQQRLPSWTRFDLGGRWALALLDRATTLRVGVTNVFDRDYWENGLVLGAPRTVSVSATVAF